jgi:dienelactone hydrolase
LTDVNAAIPVLRRRQGVGPGPVLIGGQSRGGVLSIAYAGMHPEQTLGVINFVGGWFGEKYAGAELARFATFLNDFNSSVGWHSFIPWNVFATRAR